MDLEKMTDERKRELEEVRAYLTDTFREEFRIPLAKEVCEKLDISVYEFKKRISELEELGLIKRTAAGLKLEGYQLNRLGMPLCAYCGYELNQVNDEITHENAIWQEEYECPSCGCFATFTILENKPAE